jgi:SnoaL-like domain
VRPARLVALALVLIAPAGCKSSSPEPDPDPLHSYEGRVIRGWLLALERQDYEQAAYYFAPGAIIDQGHPFRLRTPADAVNFNASLPCRADLIRLTHEGRRVLATFALHEGPGGACSGRVRVRYTIRKGKFTEWRQLPGTRSLPAPPRSSAALPGGCPGAAEPPALA